MPRAHRGMHRWSIPLLLFAGHQSVAGMASDVGSKVVGNVDLRLYTTDDTPPVDDGAAIPHRKRWHKVYKQHSGFQLIEVMHDKVRGATSLYLDRALQLTSFGEHMYHEVMAHVPMLTLKSPPQDVLVLGAGDGGVALRVLRHPGLRRLVQVELDPQVVSVSRRFFPELARAFDDPRMDLRLQDAIAWVANEVKEGRTDTFDVCIIDSTDDPLGGPWTPDFFVGLRKLLRPHGVLMQNVQSLDVPAQIDRMLRLHEAGGFDLVRPVLISTIDYGSPYIAFMSSGPMYLCGGPAREDAELTKALACSWYSPAIHRASLAVPPAMMLRWKSFTLDESGCFSSSRANHPPTGAEPSASEDLDVLEFVVVGGGLSGIAAAYVLSRHLGAARVLLVEAGERLGGRIETTDPATFGGVSANLGANWIHYARNNPVSELAEHLGCPVHTSKNSNLRWSAAGVGPLPQSAVDRAKDFATTLASGLNSIACATNSQTSGCPAWGLSAAKHLADVLARNASATAVSLAEAAARHLHIFSDVVQDHTARLQDLSSTRLCDNVAGGELSSQDGMIGGADGMGCLVRGLIAGMPEGRVEIRTGHAVGKLSHHPESVGRASSDTIQLDVSANKSAEQSYKVSARAVILAVPLGVLQSSVGTVEDDGRTQTDCRTGTETCGSAPPPHSSSLAEGVLRFKPAIDAETASAWQRMGFGRSLRVALLFDTAFWDSTVEFFGHLVDFDNRTTEEQFGGGNDFFGDVPAVEFTNALNLTGKPVLLAEVNKVLADQLEDSSDAEIGDFLLRRALRVAFSDIEVAAPRAVVVKRFHNDPFLRGALTYNSVAEEQDVSPADFVEQDWWKPIWGGSAGRLHFAGEHTSPKHKGTLDGALFAGIEAAWSAACVIGGGVTSVPRPADLVRSLGIFQGWFPSDSNFSVARGNICLDEISSRIVEHGAVGLRGCATRILDELEKYCRMFEPEEYVGDGTPQAASRRHCFDQGE